MPVAVSVMAKALGVTTQELDGMMRRGELIASEVLPKFAKELRRTAREGGALAAGMRTVTSAQNRMNVAWTTAIDSMMNAGGKEGVVDVFESLSSIISDLTPAFKNLGVFLKTLGFIMKSTIVPVFKLFSSYLGIGQSLIEAWDQSFQRLANTLEKLLGPYKRLFDVWASIHDVIKNEKNYLDALADVAVGTDRGDLLRDKINKNMTNKGISGMSSSSIKTVPNVTVNFTANGTDPKGVYQEFDKLFQGTLRGISTGAN